MREFSFYNHETGDFTGDHFATNDPDAIALNILPRKPAIEGRHSKDTHRVDLVTRKVVPRDAPPPASSLERHHYALARIRSLEASQPRALRELALGIAGAKERLQAIEDQIKTLRTELK